MEKNNPRWIECNVKDCNTSLWVIGTLGRRNTGSRQGRFKQVSVRLCRIDNMSTVKWEQQWPLGSPKLQEIHAYFLILNLAFEFKVVIIQGCG